MSSYTLQIIAYNGSALFELVLSNALTEILSGCQFFFFYSLFKIDWNHLYNL